MSVTSGVVKAPKVAGNSLSRRCRAMVYTCRTLCYKRSMIRSFRHKGLAELFGSGAKVDAALRDRVVRRLDALNATSAAADMNLPGFDFHALRGKPKRYSVHVNGPWCVTFEFEEGDAWRVDLEQYH